MKRPVNVLAQICLSLLLFGSPALAEKSSSGHITGRIDSVDLQNGTAVINDSSYLLSSGTAVYSSNGARLRMDQLKKGATVRYRLHPATSGSQPLILELQMIEVH